MSRHIFIQEHSRSKNPLAERNLTFLNSGSKILWFKSLINSILPKGADQVFNLFQISICSIVQLVQGFNWFKSSIGYKAKLY